MAGVLGYDSVGALRRAHDDDVAYRLAYLLDLSARTPASLAVLYRIVQLAGDESAEGAGAAGGDHVAAAEALVAEALVDEELRAEAALGFGVATWSDLDDAAAVEEVCSRAARFLTRAVLVARDDVDRHPDGSSPRAPVFELVVEGAFHLRDRGGTAVVGPEPASGALRGGEPVEVVRDGQVILEATADVELHARPGEVALFIPDQAAAVRVGDRVRARDGATGDSPAAGRRPAGDVPIANRAVVAAVLGYRDAGELLEADGDDVASRLAYLVDLSTGTPESLMAILRIVDLTLREASVPHVTEVRDLVEETDRIAGLATPADEDLRARVARGFGVSADPGESVAAVYEVCSRVTRFLFKAIMVARGDTDAH